MTKSTESCDTFLPLRIPASLKARIVALAPRFGHSASRVAREALELGLVLLQPPAKKRR